MIYYSRCRFRLSLGLTVLAAALSSGCAHKKVEPGGEYQVASDLKISSAKFGVLRAANSRKPRFDETNEVGLNGQTPYGWVVLIDSQRSLVKVREELTLPEVPKKWNVGSLTKISSDQRTAITESSLPVLNGHVQNFWGVGPGDPAGQYRLRVYIESVLAGDFRFRVGDGENPSIDARLPAAKR